MLRHWTRHLSYPNYQYPQQAQPQYPQQQPPMYQQRYPPPQQYPQMPPQQPPPQQQQPVVDISALQLMIEQYLQFYYTDEEIIRELERKNISTEMTIYILQKLKEQNPNYFKAYQIRLTIKSQIARFNELIQRYLVTANSQPDAAQVPQQPPQPAPYQQEMYQEGYNPNMYQNAYPGGDQNMGM